MEVAVGQFPHFETLEHRFTYFEETMSGKLYGTPIICQLLVIRELGTSSLKVIGPVLYR